MTISGGTAVETHALSATPSLPRRRRWLAPAFYPAIATLVGVVVVVTLWSLASANAWVSPVFLPSPLKVLRAFGTLSTTGYVDATLWEHATTSLGRVFSALIASIVIAVPIGIAIATSPVGRGVLDPLVEFLRPLPPLAYLPLVIIWFGIGEPSKVLVISLAMIPPLAISTASGVRAASRSQVNAARSFGATRGQVLRHVLLPSALPSIITGIRIALGTGWSTLVAAELVAASRGLGVMIQSAAQFLITDVVIAGILVISALAFVFEAGLRLAEHFFVPWSRHR
jgi:taurine transport system permease protein